MVRLGMTKRSPSTKSSNQRCCGTMRWLEGSNSVMAVSLRTDCCLSVSYRCYCGNSIPRNSSCFGALRLRQNFGGRRLDSPAKPWHSRVTGRHVLKTARVKCVDGLWAVTEKSKKQCRDHH